MKFSIYRKLSQKSEQATEDDLQVARDLLDTLNAHAEECVGMEADMISELEQLEGQKMLNIGTDAPDFTLPFTLLPDPEKKVIQAYDVWKEKKNYGKVPMGVVRTTYMIDENGIIMKAFDKVKAADNSAQMLGELS
ncbi:MAG: redoxin domain-containing protein [Bilifractor sp.]